MSAVMFGANADELDRLADEFASAADELDGECSALSGVLNRIEWLGEVATGFTGDWTGIHVRKIGLSTTFLRQASQQLRRQADEQRTASNNGTGIQGGVAAPLHFGPTGIIPTGPYLPAFWPTIFRHWDDVVKTSKVGQSAASAAKKVLKIIDGWDKKSIWKSAGGLKGAGAVAAGFDLVVTALEAAGVPIPAAVAAGSELAAKGLAGVAQVKSGFDYVKALVNNSKAGKALVAAREELTAVLSARRAELGAQTLARIKWLGAGLKAGDAATKLENAQKVLGVLSKGSKFGRVLPGLGIVGGTLGMIVAGTDIYRNGLNFTNGVAFGTSAVSTLGSVLMCIPTPPTLAAGAGLVAGAVVVDAGMAVYHNWDRITGTVKKGANAVKRKISNDIKAGLDAASRSRNPTVRQAARELRRWIPALPK